MKNLSKGYLFIFLFFCHAILNAQLRLPAVFSDRMVLQQKTKVPIWGWSKVGETVLISTTWSKEKSRVRSGTDGIWKTEIETSAAGGPYVITIQTANEKIRIKEVLLGEVWVCSGQSNIAFALKSALNSKAEIAAANNPNIRYLELKRQVSDTPLIDAAGSKWVSLSSKVAADLSAVAIFYAQKLQKELNVPVGIIEVAWGGTAADNWTPKQILANDDRLKIALTRFDEGNRNFKMDSIGYTAQLVAKKKGVIEKVPDMPESMWIKARPHRAPSVLYNGLINPLIDYGIKGVIWYQGETNRKWSSEYSYLLESMIASWRKAWNKEFPFYIVQLPRFGGNIEQVSEIMEAQLQTYRKVENTGLIVTMDLGDMNDIHPINKKPVGDRIANWALANAYQFNTIDFSGPLFKSVTNSGNQVQINFDFVGEGLKTNGELQGFEIVEIEANGTLKKPVVVVPKIDKKRLIFDDVKITKPFIVRYGWAEKMENANLYNEANLPASPFRVLVK